MVLSKKEVKAFELTKAKFGDVFRKKGGIRAPQNKKALLFFVQQGGLPRTARIVNGKVVEDFNRNPGIAFVTSVKLPSRGGPRNVVGKPGFKTPSGKIKPRIFKTPPRTKGTGIAERAEPALQTEFMFSANETFGVRKQRNPRRNPAFGDFGMGNFFPSRKPNRAVGSILPKRKFKGKVKVVAEKPLKSIFDLSF